MSLTTIDGRPSRPAGGRPPMSEYSTVFGIDSHARTTTVCAIVVETGETATRTFPGVSPYAEAASWMSSFPGPRMGRCEAGCTGFTPARMLSGGDTRVAPIATHSMPASPEARARKTDRTDAARLARAGLAGRLSEVWVPDPGVEGLRDACHFKLLPALGVAELPPRVGAAAPVLEVVVHRRALLRVSVPLH